MKKSLLVILALTLIVATVSALLIGAPSPVHAAGNRVQNPGFESALGPEWTVAGNATRVCGGVGFNSLCAAQINDSSGHFTQVVNVTPVARYKIWGWIDAPDNEVTGTIALTFMNGSTEITTYALSATKTVGYEYQSLEVRAPALAAQLRIRLSAGGIDLDTNDALFDDIGVSIPMGGCFIATAAYGTPMAEEIDVLRQFRDEYLLTNPAGGLLVSLYYTSSPPLAHLISQNEGLRAVTRMVLEPIIWFSSIFTAPPTP